MPRPKKCHVLIVDDHPTVRLALRGILEATEDCVVSGEAQDSAEAIVAVESFLPDLALVDISLRGDDGIELTRLLHARWPALPVLVVSLHEEQLYSDRARSAGARGYCAKMHTSTCLVAAIRRILQGQAFVHVPFGI